MNYGSLFYTRSFPLLWGGGGGGVKISLEETGDASWVMPHSHFALVPSCSGEHFVLTEVKKKKKEIAHGRCYFYRHAREVAVNQSV